MFLKTVLADGQAEKAVIREMKARAEGARGAVGLADTRSLDTGLHAVDCFERRQVPFVVAVNRFDGATPYKTEEVREALDISAHVPVLMADARERASAKEVLVRLVTHVIDGRRPALSG